MKVVVVGAAGHVGSILRPSLEREHDCRYFDRHPVEGADDRTIVGDVNDDAAIARAVDGVDGVIYLAMGIKPGTRKSTQDIDAAFDVNTKAVYRWLKASLGGGAKHFVFASSLSVYCKLLDREEPIDEASPADASDPYGLTKRLTEVTCDMVAGRYPEATLVSLRLMWPLSESDTLDPDKRRTKRSWFPLWPGDCRRLFGAALAVNKPGHHIVQATGDVAASFYAWQRAHDILGWKPEGQ